MAMLANGKSPKDTPKRKYSNTPPQRKKAVQEPDTDEEDELEVDEEDE